MKQQKIKVELPTADYYEAEVKCRNSCPVKTDARGYLMATVAGKYEEAYAISRATNPFASICGKVCGAPCDDAGLSAASTGKNENRTARGGHRRALRVSQIRQ